MRRSTSDLAQADTVANPQIHKASTLRFALILGGLTAFGPLSIDTYLPALPQMADELKAAPTTAQLTLTTVLLGLAFGQMVAGPLSDTTGRRKPLLVGLSLYIVTSVGCALAGSVYSLIALRALQGFSAAAGMVIARATVRDLYSGTAAARFFSNLMLVTGLGPILAPVIGGQVLAHTDWRGVFVVLCALGAVLLAATIFLLPETKPPQWRQPAHLGATFRTFRYLLSNRVFLGNALAAGLGMATMFAYVSGSSFVLQDIYGMSPQTFSLVFGSNAVGLVLAGQINGRIVGRLASESQLLTGALVAASLAGLALLSTTLLGMGLPVVLVTLFVMISSVGFIMPNCTLLALNPHEEIAGSASALLGVSQFVVGALAGPLVGLGGTSSAVPMAAVMFGVVLAAAVVYFILGRPRRSQQDPMTMAQGRAQETQPVAE